MINEGVIPRRDARRELYLGERTELPLFFFPKTKLPPFTFVETTSYFHPGNFFLGRHPCARVCPRALLSCLSFPPRLDSIAFSWRRIRVKGVCLSRRHTGSRGKKGRSIVRRVYPNRAVIKTAIKPYEHVLESNRFYDCLVSSCPLRRLIVRFVIVRSFCLFHPYQIGCRDQVVTILSQILI